MKINLEYGRPQGAVESVSNAALTQNYIEFAAGQAYKDGFKIGSQRRTFGRLQRKLDAAIDAKQDDIELADDEKDLLVDIFSKELAFEPALSKYVVVLEDEIERVRTADQKE